MKQCQNKEFDAKVRVVYHSEVNSPYIRLKRAFRIGYVQYVNLEIMTEKRKRPIRIKQLNSKCQIPRSFEAKLQARQDMYDDCLCVEVFNNERQIRLFLQLGELG